MRSDLAGNGWNGIRKLEGIELIRYASEKGINILDCWMADPKSRNIIGEGIKENRISGSFRDTSGLPGRTDSISRTREMKYVSGL